MTGKVIRFPTELRQAQVFEDRVDAFLNATPLPPSLFEAVSLGLIPLEMLLGRPSTVQVVVLREVEVGDLVYLQDILDENDLF